MKHLYILAATLCILFTSCTAERWHNLHGAVWNTTYNIKYEGSIDLTDSIFEIFNIIDKSVSIFDNKSLVNKINNNETTQVDESFIKVFEASKYISIKSKGKFDPTVGPLIELWGFGKNKKEEWIVPSTEEIISALNTVGIKDCSIVDFTIHKKSPLTKFNFSAIAKGYGCDLIAEMLMRNGIKNYMIEIGGELRLGGHNDRNKKWLVQIDDPTSENDGIVKHRKWKTIEVTDCGIATSGNYRNFHINDSTGEKFGHTIDPVTGYPVQTDILSATIIAPTAMEADAIATACMTMTAREAREFLELLHVDKSSVIAVEGE